MLPDDARGAEAARDDEGRRRVRGIEVHHRVAGETAVAPVLLLHHFYGSVATWRHVLPRLAPEHRVLAFDRPGFGLTERPPRRAWNGVNPYSRHHAAVLGWSLLDAVVDDAEAAVLIGASAGGTTALEMYRQAPHRVRALVLISPAITGDIGPPEWARPVLRRQPFAWLGPKVIRRFAGEVTRQRVSGGWHDPRLADEDDVAAYADPLRASGWERGLWEVMTSDRRPDLRSLLPRIEVPTLVVSGASDRVISPRWNQRTAAAIPGAELTILPDCGHTPHEECPDALVAEVRRFLGEHGLA